MQYYLPPVNVPDLKINKLRPQKMNELLVVTRLVVTQPGLRPRRSEAASPLLCPTEAENGDVNGGPRRRGFGLLFLLHKCFLSTCYMPGFLLGTRNGGENMVSVLRDLTVETRSRMFENLSLYHATNGRQVWGRLGS